MGSGQPDSDVNMELDDSGCVQDESPPAKPVVEEDGYVGQASLLDLSDDVLLYILRYCSPQTLKALGYSCPRLGALVLERALWTHVDARGVGYGRDRTRWLLNYALHAGTKELLLTGFATNAEGCQGHVNLTREEEEYGSKQWRGRDAGAGAGAGDASSGDDLHTEHEADNGHHRRRGPPLLFRHDAESSRLHMNPLHHLPRLSSSPYWPDSDSEDSDTGGEPSERCEGPVFTLGRHLLKRLRSQCPVLTTLYLENCNLNCNKTPLCNFPPTLEQLSLKGTRCYNLPLDKSYLFKIHDYLPVLEYLELSDCAWLEPATLLPLSKLVRLRALRMRRCPAMQEFVAYVSLATRYGFRKLQMLDFRGSPVGDSEVAALGWLPELRELYLSAPPASAFAAAADATHSHYRGDRRDRTSQTAAWEGQVPDYYATSRYPEDSTTTTTAQEAEDNCVNLAPNSLDISEDFERDENGERKRKTENGDVEEAGPSKRPKEEGDTSESIDNMQNSKTSIVNNNGFVTFRRTIFNNITEINKRLNSDTDDNSGNHKKNEKESPENDDKGTPEKEDKQSPKQDNKSSKTSDNRFSNRVTIDVNDGASTSSCAGRFRVSSRARKSEEKDEPSSNKYDEKFDDIPENVDKMDADNGEPPADANNGEPPAKKIRLESDVEYQDKFEKMSTDESSSDGQSENMEVNIIASNTEDLNPTFAANVVGQSSRDSSYTDRSDPNVSSLISNRSNSQGESSTLTGPSVEAASPSGLNQVSSSLSSRLSRLRRSVGLEASPSNQGRSQRSNHVGSGRASSSNRVGSSPSNDLNRSGIPAPSMEGPSQPPSDRNPSQYVRFRRNQDPVVIQCPAQQQEVQPEQAEQAEPRHHVLYVNLGQQLHAVYRLLPSRPMFHSRSRSLSAERLDSSSLVTDSAIRRFGRADGEDVNIVNIGPNGPQFGGRDMSGRPNRSNLRILSATGYRNITNRSLVHLATAAPFLQFIDFTNTGVTESGVEHFRGVRPDCRVNFSEFIDSDEE